MGKNGARSEIGHAYLFNGKKLEDVISFSALLHKEVDEIEGAEALYQDKEKLSIAACFRSNHFCRCFVVQTKCS